MESCFGKRHVYLDVNGFTKNNTGAYSDVFAELFSKGVRNEKKRLWQNSMGKL